MERMELLAVVVSTTAVVVTSLEAPLQINVQDLEELDSLLSR